MGDAARKSDLAVRTASAIVMLGVAGTALYMGGTVFMFFVALVAFLVVLEWRGLVVLFPDDNLAKGIWMAIGGVYAAFACAAVLMLQEAKLFVPILAAVIGTDIGAYFAGRLIGGPKIAPAISPSKTWAGLGGGIVGSTLLLVLMARFYLEDTSYFLALATACLLVGPILAVVAQAGDFFESWMKRRAGVKDSGTLIPGHGGMFDRVDGLLAASIAGYIVFRAMGALA
ncbi:MAG: phosphatidate cytidylyltransferase [Sphingobium sp.]|nr:phosphatidate cytidylyltransferase [Sphingobium sp.]